MVNSKLYMTVIGLCMMSMLWCSQSFAVDATSSEVNELSLCHAAPPFEPGAQVIQKWASMVEEKSQGRAKLNIVCGRPLLNPPRKNRLQIMRPRVWLQEPFLVRPVNRLVYTQFDDVRGDAIYFK